MMQLHFSSDSDIGELNPFLSRPFTSLPKWVFWNTGRKNNRSVLKPMEIDIVDSKLEFKRTQNPKLHAPIPIWGLDARVATHQRIGTTRRG
ncbi:hypothetical protein AVEN_268746-1 [Araneus ventricosus]|uniref:Uncharacterized protein n=1 Tax=Araneus ventricosus TaxID=182803 RepID=A0A4Y2H482_ARAVE|nr:hypothetical protein AVEN_268746-1 [Araneus ventricosus]